MPSYVRRTKAVSANLTLEAHPWSNHANGHCKLLWQVESLVSRARPLYLVSAGGII